MNPKRRFGRRYPGVERRSAEREELGITVSLLSMTQSRVVRMMDVSLSGVRITGRNLPGLGEEVILKVAEVELFGSIVRVAEGEAAIQFASPMETTELERLRAIHEEQARDPMQYL